MVRGGGEEEDLMPYVARGEPLLSLRWPHLENHRLPAEEQWRRREKEEEEKEKEEKE